MMTTVTYCLLTIHQLVGRYESRIFSRTVTYSPVITVGVPFVDAGNGSNPKKNPADRVVTSNKILRVLVGNDESNDVFIFAIIVLGITI